MLARNRYIKAIISRFPITSPRVVDGEWCVDLPAYEDNQELDDFQVMWGDGTEVSLNIPPLLLQAVSDLSVLDNLVQDSCESEFKGSNYALENYMLHIAYVTIAGDEVHVHYYGSKVNTEWTAKFSLDSNKWNMLNPQ